MEPIIRQLTQAGIQVRENEPLSEHTSFRIGGPVRVMVFACGDAQLIEAARILRAADVRPILIGNGSNLLAADGPIDGVAIKTFDTVSQVQRTGDHSIYAPAGMLLSRAAVSARDLGLAGLAFAHGIPGTLGGAVYMNAGAYGGEMAQVVTRVRYLDEDLTEQTASGTDLAFAYRNSCFVGTDNLILGAEMTLTPGDPAEIGAEMDALAAKRKAGQPLEWPSGGSTFKRPQTGYAAALIEEAGLKGCTVGGAQVSEKHAGFVINRGGATCEDVLRLMAHVQETVARRTGVRLDPEVRRVP